MKCDECGKTLEIGDYPFCGPDGHTTIHSRNAQVAAPTVVFKNAKGEYRLPGRDTDRPPRGFERIELRTQRQRDRFEREFGARETSRLHDVEYGRHEAWKQTFAAHKDRLLEIKKRSSSPVTKGFVDACLRDAEQRANRSVGRHESGFMIESNHIDSSNRIPWMDKDTGWKPRK